MGMTIEKMYGSYSDADLNDWERFPMNSRVLTSSAFGAWLLRRDERRDKAIPKSDYENRLKADMVAMLEELKSEIEEIEMGNNVPFGFEPVNKFYEEVSASSKVIQQKIDALKEEVEDGKA